MGNLKLYLKSLGNLEEQIIHFDILTCKQHLRNLFIGPSVISIDLWCWTSSEFNIFIYSSFFPDLESNRQNV
jgi:hypothetical protein